MEDCAHYCQGGVANFLLPLCCNMFPSLFHSVQTDACVPASAIQKREELLEVIPCFLQVCNKIKPLLLYGKTTELNDGATEGATRRCSCGMSLTLSIWQGQELTEKGLEHIFRSCVKITEVEFYWGRSPLSFDLDRKPDTLHRKRLDRGAHALYCSSQNSVKCKKKLWMSVSVFSFWLPEHLFQ